MCYPCRRSEVLPKSPVDLKINGSASVSTMFWRMMGQEQINITATGEVTWGIKKLNLALAFDNTGSMASSGKMAALKEAAHNLLTTLKNAEKTPGDIKVSIVPFAVDVNVGTANVDATWIDWTDWEAANGTCSKSSYHSKSSCIANYGVWTPKDHSYWNGCVNDRDQNNDVLNTATAEGSPATKYRAHQATACPASMMTLTLRLDRAQRQGRCHDADRQHQRHHRPAAGLADACRR